MSITGANNVPDIGEQNRSRSAKMGTIFVNAGVDKGESNGNS